MPRPDWSVVDITLFLCFCSCFCSCFSCLTRRLPTGLSSPFFISSSLAIERTCSTRGGQPQAWRRRIQAHIASSSSWLSLWNCWLRAAAVFRPLIRSQRVLVGIPYWRAIFAWEGFSLAAEASFQRAWASVMRSSCESSISSEGMKDIGGVGGVAAIVLLICWRIIPIKNEMWIFSPIGLSTARFSRVLGEPF